MSFAKGLVPFSYEIEELSDDELEKLYAAGFAFYEIGELDKAEDFFTRGTLHAPFEKRFWKGLASARHLKKTFKEALHAWAMLCFLEKEDPAPHFHAAECLISLRDFKQAKVALQSALKRAQKNLEWTYKIETLMERLPHE